MAFAMRTPQFAKVEEDFKLRHFERKRPGKFTAEEVKKHCTQNDCWIIVNKKVYDATFYMKNLHPGGMDLIFNNAGRDATNDFEAGFHSQNARLILERFYLGDLVKSTMGGGGGGSGSFLTPLGGGFRAGGMVKTISASSSSKYPPPPPPPASSSSSIKNNNTNTGFKKLSIGDNNNNNKGGLTTKTTPPPPPAAAAPPSSSSSSSVSGGSQSQVLDLITFRGFKVISVTQHTHNSKIIKISIPGMKRLGLKPGQHISIAGSGDNPNETKPESRSYTPITDSAGYAEILFKIYPNGPVSSYLGTLTVGDQLFCRGPLGRFTYEGPILQNKNGKLKKTLLMIAGGSGITPMVQLYKAILSNAKDETQLRLIYANRHEEDIMMRQAIEMISTSMQPRDRFRARFILSHPPEDSSSSSSWTGDRGRVDAAVIEKIMKVDDDEQGGADVQWTNESFCVVCGPDGFNAHVEGILVKQFGFSEADYHIFQ